MEKFEFARKVSFKLDSADIMGRIIEVNKTTYKIVTTGQKGGIYDIKKENVKFLDEVMPDLLKHDVERMIKRLSTNESEKEATAKRLAYWIDEEYTNKDDVIKKAKLKYNLV